MTLCPSFSLQSSQVYPSKEQLTGRRKRSVSRAAVSEKTEKQVTAKDVDEWNKKGKIQRLEHLEEQALETLKHALYDFERPAFPCALIAGDVVILDLLARSGAFSKGLVKVIFVDTFHLFEETHTFLRQLENKYGFESEVFQAAGFASRADYVKVHGPDLYLTDIDEYDRICKVEPFGRALKTLKVDAMINGRRRDHGAERAHIELFEGGDMVKVNPLAYWEFRDCWDYIKKYSLAYHPLHDQGYPSVGDIHSTLPVPREQWFEYAGERSGRFQGLTNKDGSAKTECGIHVGDARQVASEISSSL
ncbi:Phosphoadenosine phosphosulfate reductase [Klebsormidium nitens]|uniref:Phosphoadenosine phosphosulfate reductase n=1 Tax=Klebsormidium nitens TaxID=105231 RepID=A0A1Y1IE60_KLENI|nr:Phosphoadenosine phosphosulfate reductase [Klebsormidium nitens]|eukprot:GAQ87007.1 Phosphoadenosine phosphosulfate reductase [Klebsormidium nitens]